VDRVEPEGYLRKRLQKLHALKTILRNAILKAVNLGDDADTTAAVCGQITGAYHGESGIPAGWLKQLSMRDKITEFADKLREGGPGA
jgi:ADP-ribosyl-[dinitrogen reductase] hydrolase